MNRDPIAYEGSEWNLYEYGASSPAVFMDPTGADECKINIFVGHNFNIKKLITDTYPPRDGDRSPFNIPLGQFVIGVGCGANVDVDSDGKVDSIQDFLEATCPCRSVEFPTARKLDDPVQGLTPDKACNAAREALDRARSAVGRLLKDESANPGKCRTCPDCDSVQIVVTCDDDAKELFQNGRWKNIPVPDRFPKNCKSICDTDITIPSR